MDNKSGSQGEEPRDLPQTPPETDMQAKKMARITACVLPALYFISLLDQIDHAGFAGYIMLIFLVPLSLLAAVILRFVSAPVYRILLNKSSHTRLRRVIAGVGILLAVGFAFVLCKNAFFPYDSVNESIKKIPEMQAYFIEHKDEFEAQRLQATDGERKFEVAYDEESAGLLSIDYIYDGANTQSTGYVKPYCYRHKLDEQWYIEIFLAWPH